MSDPDGLLSYESVPLKHSGAGIASLVISVMVAGGDFLIIGIAAYMKSSKPPGDEKGTTAALLGFLLIGGLALAFAGAALGVAGLLQRDKKRLAAMLGLSINGCIFLFVMYLLVIGHSRP